MLPLPSLFLERLRRILPEIHFDSVVRSLTGGNVLSARINTIKADKREVIDILKERKIDWRDVPWYADALILENISSRDLSDTRLLKEGFLYVQGLSSMLPALVLDPKPGETVLDLCAAPGSKATQMAAMMNNRGRIIAVEPVRNRFYRLKSVASLMGAEILELKMADGRRFHFPEFFDKILVDVPCSSEGRFNAADPKTYAYWSPRKIKEMVRKQKGLLLNAARLLKPGGVLVYATCTFAPEENEGVIDWLLRREDNRVYVEPIKIDGVGRYPPLFRWGKKEYCVQVSDCCRVALDREGRMEGFFMAKLVRGD